MNATSPQPAHAASNPEFDKSLAAARLYLWSNFPFLYWLLNSLKVQVTDEVETAAVDAHDNLYINRAFFLGLAGVKQRAFLLAHETLHPALGIFWRSHGHDPVLSNVAHDFVINLLLKEEDKEWVLDSALLDEKYKGMAYEQVYRLVAGAGDFKLPMSDVIFSTSDGKVAGSAPEAERKAKEWTTRIVAAQLYSDGLGKTSRTAARCLSLAQGAVVSWQEVLRQACAEAFSRSRLDWNTPHRRSDSLGIYLPRESLVGVDATVVVDTSGSITKGNTESALREIAGIIEAAGGSIRWLVGDTQVLSDEIIREVPEQLAGCGGTDFRPFFSHLEEAGQRTRMLVYFTDTYGEFPAEAPDYPVIWAVFDNENEVEVPFGEVIKIPANTT